jgi:ribonuclease HI
MYHSDEFKVENQNYDLFSGQTEGGQPVDVEIWTDGACINNGKPNASAAWGFVSGAYEKAGRVEGKQTNNRAEAEAILHALQWAGDEKHRRVRILCDTQITIFSLQKPLEKIVANRDIFEKIYRVIAKYDLIVEYEKVRGHSGVEQNERVDKLANTLAMQSQ